MTFFRWKILDDALVVLRHYQSCGHQSDPTFSLLVSEGPMDFARRHITGLKMCLNHSQAGIEESLLELEGNFRACIGHSNQRSLLNKLIEHLVSFRWILDQHFTRVAGEGYLENVASMRPGMYIELREIECQQSQLIDDLDLLIHRVRNCDGRREALVELSQGFQRLHAAILDEESLERSLVEKGLA